MTMTQQPPSRTSIEPHGPLQKWLQAMGVGTKRQVRALIASGRVAIDSIVTCRFAEPLSAGVQVEIDGKPLTLATQRIVLLMNKPKKHLTLIDDEPDKLGLGRYLPPDLPRVSPVGRLDFNTEGALLWTNDGFLARRVLHPDWHLPKRYGIKIRGHLDDDHAGLQRMRNGMTVGGERYQPAQVRTVAKRTRATWVELIIHQGKHRQIRRMCWACHFQIVKLRRLAIGPIELGDLNPRCVRHLSDDELLSLDRAVGLEPKATSQVDQSEWLTPVQK